MSVVQLNQGTSSSTSPRASETVHASSYGRIDKTKHTHKKMQLQQNLMSSPKQVSNEVITNCRLIYLVMEPSLPPKTKWKSSNYFRSYSMVEVTSIFYLVLQ